MVLKFDSPPETSSIVPYMHLQRQIVAICDLVEQELECLPRKQGVLPQFRKSIHTVERQIQSMYERSEMLATAQAEAIVYSSEVIDELEETKKNLSEAQVAAEEAARDTQRLSETIFERSHDGVFILDGALCIACNDNAARLFGVERDAIMHRWPFCTAVLGLAKKDESACRRLLSDAADSGATLELQHTRPDGLTLWCDVSMSALNMNSGDHVLVIVRDVTSRKRCEEERQTLQSGKAQEVRNAEDESLGERLVVGTEPTDTEAARRESRQQLLASVFDSAGEGILVLTSDGRICELNAQFSRVVGKPAHDLEGRDFAEALGGEFDSLREHIISVAAGSHWSGSLELKDQNRWLWVSLSPAENKRTGDRVVGLFSDVTALKGIQNRLKHQAFHDNLTGLPNRRYFRHRLGELCQQARENTSSLAVCFLDLDDFKNVNDTSGHRVGDQLLAAVAGRIQQSVRPGDFVARFGGDEFAVILTEDHLGKKGVWQSCQRILDALGEPFVLENPENGAVIETTVGASIGTTLYPLDDVEPDVLMQNADSAMYAAKASGKNQVRPFAAGMHSQVSRRNRLQYDLRQANDAGELFLMYQPKVAAANRCPTGCEALARWTKKDGTMIPPGEFIDVAEKNGLIIEIGRDIFRQAAEQCCQWKRMGLDPLPVAVNISPRQLRHHDFIRQLKDILESTNARPEWFELEITENAIVDNIYHAIETINELTEIGFRVAMDDFGTGYSSLSYLKSFPIDTLKIDISFVRDVVENPKTSAIAKTIIALGSGLGLTTVAEGVETEAQAAWLREQGCDVLQGYLISRPLRSDDFEAWLRSQVANSQLV